MTFKTWLHLRVLGGLLLLWVVSCYGQVGKAEFFGVVLDGSGLPVPQVTVGLEDQATLVKRSSSTSERGEYYFFGLGPGSYRVSASKKGFRTYRHEGVQLRVADRIAW